MARKHCEGCGKELGVIEAAMWSVCMDCTKARQRAVMNSGRCTCRSKRPGPVAGRAGARQWIPCKRCLGSIRQVS